MAPTAARPDTGDGVWGWMLGRALWPRLSMPIVDFRDWLAIVDRFVGAAVAAHEAGWEGVQVHSAHGYLLAEYLSPLVSRAATLGFSLLAGANETPKCTLSLPIALTPP